ncbi:MAG: right-handed parallel beta-helix repeat-containing protein [candidate division WOR-3 bacterium]|nr:MAG: right-handed parallel beta-helix repeat-containing protein [candidate division WOR-3 bacterium]
MTMRIAVFLAATALILIAHPGHTAGESHPNVYYISPCGNDTNPGTYELPLLTIQAGVNRACPGDLVMVLAGTYNEKVIFPRSGADGFPITVRGEVDSEGNPLAVIDNTAPVEPLWEPAPEVGSGVYKRIGFAPKIMLYNGGQILKINKWSMAGESTAHCDKGFNILAYPASKTWAPLGYPWTVSFWDHVGVLFGVLGGETTYIRFRGGDDPDTCALRSTEDATAAFSLSSTDYITIEHLKIEGCLKPIVLDNSSYNIIQHNVIRNGDTRIRVENNSAYNLIRHNYITLGYGDYGHFGEWGSQATADNCASYTLGKYLEGHGSSRDQGIRLSSCGGGNEISNNEIRRGAIGITLGASNVIIRDNLISDFSSCGMYLGKGVKNLHVYNNEISHCNTCIRFGSIGAPGDTYRSGWVYSNRTYNAVGAGRFLFFHEGGNDYTKPPDFWFYHNSYAGGDAWAAPRVDLCRRMKLVNNIMSGKRLAGDTRPEDDTVPTLFMGFDYNFLGGLYRGYRYHAWAGRDRHNIWAADTMEGDTNHQVWPLGPEPDWIVPDTSPAYRYGLDLSQPFTIRGVTYDPLPGMEPGYFPGDKPNLGAVQYSAHVREPQLDPEHRSVTQLPELAIAPNPAARGYVIARYAVPAGKVGKLTLRDVAGRTVMSHALQGRQKALVFSWDCRDDAGRSVPAGVYVARLEVPGFSETIKLVLQR